jgi:hypothetical protein
MPEGGGGGTYVFTHLGSSNPLWAPNGQAIDNLPVGGCKGRPSFRNNITKYIHHFLLPNNYDKGGYQTAPGHAHPSKELQPPGDSQALNMS